MESLSQELAGVTGSLLVGLHPIPSGRTGAHNSSEGLFNSPLRAAPGFSHVQDQPFRRTIIQTRPEEPVSTRMKSSPSPDESLPPPPRAAPRAADRTRAEDDAYCATADRRRRNAREAAPCRADVHCGAGSGRNAQPRRRLAGEERDGAQGRDRDRVWGVLRVHRAAVVSDDSAADRATAGTRRTRARDSRACGRSEERLAWIVVS